MDSNAEPGNDAFGVDTAHDDDLSVPCFSNDPAELHVDAPEPHSCDHDADSFQYFGGPGFDHAPDYPQFPSCPSGEQDLLPGVPGSWLDPNSNGVDISGTDRSVNGTASFQPTVTDTVHHAIFSRALLTNCEVTNIVLPWETGFYKEFFSDDPFLRSLVPAVQIDEFCNFGSQPEPQSVAEAVAGVASCSAPGPIFASCIACVDDGFFQSKRQQLYDAAVSKLLIVLRHCLLASSTGRHIIALGTEQMQDAGASGVLEAVLGVKSPATLIKRANSLLSFLRWLAKNGIQEVNPFTEEMVWKYLQFLRESSAPATKGDSAMSAFRFAYHVLGFESLGPAMTSRRLAGICELMMSGKRMLKQALVLTVAQVKGLHTALKNTALHVYDRTMVAYLLFALYGRCRNSELALIKSFEADFSDEGGFVVIHTCNHKTGRLATLKTRLMPIIIPARGVDGEVWVKEALAVFDAAGVELSDQIDGPLVHAPSSSVGGFMKRGLRSSEVSAMLRRFINVAEPVPGDSMEIPSSHSLKATTLSWCARYGLSPATRSLLGRHTNALTETYAIYSRDLMGAPTAELQRVIDEIADGSFCPDNPRSEFFRRKDQAHDMEKAAGRTPGLDDCASVKSSLAVPSLMSELHDFQGEEVPGCADAVSHPPARDPELAGDAALVEGQVVEESDDSDSSTDSSGCLSSDDSDLVEPPPKVKRFRARIPEGQRWYVHSKSHLVHRFDGDDHNGLRFLVCGKRLTEAFTLCTEASAWNVLCKSCNRRRDGAGLSG